jgi:signal transduction histidine kinase
MDKENHSQNEPLREIVDAALEQSELYGRSEVLKLIAAAVNAYACVIWELAPGSGVQSISPSEYLFVSNRWFADNHVYAFHDLPLESVAGKTVLAHETISVVDTDSVNEDPKYLKSLGVRTLLSVPITFTDKVTRGALLLYRKQPVPFSTHEIKLVQQFALVLPLVNETIRVKTIFKLTSEVDRILSRANVNKYVRRGEERFREALHNAIENICELCSKTFHTVETSIFLDNRTNNSGGFTLIATTSPVTFEQTTIYPHDQGHTSWVLTNKKSVRIFDLSHFGSNFQKIQSIARTVLQLHPDDNLPPISFMACPIMMGEKVLGAIRCCISKSGTYFNDEDISLLELVAAKISQYWTDWMKEWEVQEENKLWQEFSIGFSELNTFALYELNRKKPDANQIFAKAMILIKSVIKGVEGIDIRLLDENKPESFTAAVYGDAWLQGASIQPLNRRNLRFPVHEELPPSAGAYELEMGKAQAIEDTSQDSSHYDVETLPNTKHLIVAPIKFEDKIFGVLDVHVNDGAALPRNAVAIVELIGHQLGLYRNLIVNVGRLRAAEDKLNNQVKERVQALSDLTHQLRSPINQAFARIESVLKGDADNDLSSQLILIRGLFRKAHRVTSSIGLYAALAGNRSFNVAASALDYDYLIKMLTETATDCEMLIESTRNIRVEVDQSSFEQLRHVRVEVDKILLEQAFGNILDNALKYSYGNTVINVFGGLDGFDRFSISVKNVGLPIEEVDIDRVVERGWRSKGALLATGEGSGIGLWIVANIMKAHGGELEITPTTSNHVTEVKLFFPIKGR